MHPQYCYVWFREKKNTNYMSNALTNSYRCYRHYIHRSATGERVADEKTCRQPLAYRIARRLWERGID